jgi:surface protein
MREMFYGCSSLQSINLSSFNTTNVENMSGMFLGCSSLKKENVKISNNGKRILDEDCWN